MSTPTRNDNTHRNRHVNPFLNGNGPFLSAIATPPPIDPANQDGPRPGIPAAQPVPQAPNIQPPQAIPPAPNIRPPQAPAAGGSRSANRSQQRTYPGPALPRRVGPTWKKDTKASIKISALNIKGRGNPNVLHDDNKWYHIWQLVREQKIGVLIVGEAHLDDNHKADVDNLFGRAIRVEFTPDEIAPAARAGLAFVLNKNMVETQGIKVTEIVPGRAMTLEMKNVDGEPLSILGVYAPNAPSENAAFWRKIKAWYVAHPAVRRPHYLGGDTNFVEDTIDRLPAHEDSANAVDAFDKLKTYLRLVDGWRETYPTTRAYTFLQPIALGGSQSRIDRIYVRRDFFNDTYEWDIQAVGINTDHRMVSVRATTEDAPTIGPGRWRWPAHIIRDPVLTKFIYEEGLELQKDLETAAQEEAIGQQNPNRNAQTLWAGFKIKISEKARQRAKIVVPKIVEEIDELKNKIDLAQNPKDKTLTEEEKILSCAVWQEKLTALERKQHHKTRLTAQVNNRLHGEVIGPYWTAIN
ncbi:hypothetical protein C8F04DRAFT_962517, partial [Mycena alexandri]